ncbi:MAG: hypothetical protein AAGF49_03050, partial [Pseudomonadota bacterium]
GSEFAVAGPRQNELVADLVFANADEWVTFQASRRKDIGVLRGVVEFLSLAVFQTVRGLSYLFTAAPNRRQGGAGEDGEAVRNETSSRRPDYLGADPGAVVSSGSGAAATLQATSIARGAMPRPER